MIMDPNKIRVKRQVRLVSLVPDIGSPSVWFDVLLRQLEQAFAIAARQRGLDYVVFAGKDAVQAEQHSVRVVPTFAGDRAGSWSRTSTSDWPRLWRSSRGFCDNVLWSLRKLEAADVGTATNIIFFYHAHAVHIAGAIRLGLALRGRAPIVLNLYYLNEVYGDHRPSRAVGLREFLSATRGLRRAANVHLRVGNARLAAAVLRDTGEKMEVLPFITPVDDGSLQPTEAKPPGTLRIAFPTSDCGTTKGFDLVMGLAERLNRPNVEIVMREPYNGLQEFLQIPLAARHNLRTFPSVLSTDGYLELVRSSDVIVVPYRRRAFRNRTSSSVADAIVLGKPMVGTADTWIGDQIKTLGAGLTFPDGDVDQFVAAVEQVLDNHKQFRSSLLAGRDAWIEENSPRAFVRTLVDRLGTGSDERGVSDTVSSPPTRRPISSVVRDLRLLQLRVLLHVVTPLRGKVLEPTRCWMAEKWARLLFPPNGRLWLGFDTAGPGGIGSRFAENPVVYWRTRGVEAVELRLDAFDGMLIHRGKPQGTFGSPFPVPEGRPILLQDASPGLGPSRRNTLARICFPTAREGLGVLWKPMRRYVAVLPAIRLWHRLADRRYGRLTMTVSDDVFMGGRSEGQSAMSVRWTVPVGAAVEIRLGAPDGLLFAKAQGPGVKVTPRELTLRAIPFYLMDASREHRVRMLGILDIGLASDYWRRRYATTALEQSWRVFTSFCRGLGEHLISRGQLRADVLASGSARSGAGIGVLPLWARRAAAKRESSTRFAYHAVFPVVRAVNRLVARRTGHLDTTPVAVGNELHVRVDWTAPDGLPIEIRVGVPDGRLFAKTKGSGSQMAGAWAVHGVSFYLLDSSRESGPAMYRTLDVATSSEQTPRRQARAIGVARTALAMVFDGSVSTIWRRALRFGDDGGPLAAVGAPSQDDEAARTAPDQAPPTTTIGAPRREVVMPAVSRTNRVIGPEEWGIVPPPALGETMLVASYSVAFLEAYGGKGLVIFQTPNLQEVCRLFPHAPIRTRDASEFMWTPGAWGYQTGRLLRWDYPIGYWMGVNEYTGMEVQYSSIYLNLARLRPDSPHLVPRVESGLRDAAGRHLRELGMKEGRSALLLPSSKRSPQVPLESWVRIANVLQQRGYTVATNIAPGEVAVPGTIELRCSLSELYAISELAGLLLSSRSGACDLCATARTRIHILRPDRALVLCEGGITLLRSLLGPGRRDPAVYHTMGMDETLDAFSQRVLAHADLA